MEVALWTLFIALITGAVFGIFIGTLAAKVKAAKNSAEAAEVFAKNSAETAAALAKSQTEAENLKQILAESRQDYEKNKKEALEIQQKQFDETIGKIKAEMEVMTGKVLKERQEEFKNANRDDMNTITAPFLKKLEELQKIINDSKSGNEKSMTELGATIKAVMERSEQLSKDSKNLTEALKSRGKVQGDWGERVLIDILQESGLREGKEYEIQKNFQDDGKNSRPDVIINSPDGSKIIIDSKVSLTAYTNYVGAENDEERLKAAKENYESIWRHVNELAGKYEKIVENAVPKVLMFIPNEGSYLLAMNYSQDLGNRAFKQGVIIINPTNLMLALELILITWQNTRQEENCRKIINAAGDLYDKFSIFSNTMVKLGNQISSSNKAISETYNTAVNQLKEGKNNVVKQINGLKLLGAKSNKQINEKLSELNVSSILPSSEKSDSED